MGLGMVAVVVLPGAMLPVAVGLLGAAAALGRAARTEMWPREVIVDLWAMALLTVSALATPGHTAGSLPSPFSLGSVTAAASGTDPSSAHPVAEAIGASHHGSAPTTLFELMVNPVVVLTAWLLARVLLGVAARRTGRIRHVTLTAAATLAQLLLMLTLH